MVRRHPILLAGHGSIFVAGLALLIFVRNHLPAAGVIRGLVGAAILALVLRTAARVAAWNVDRFIVTDARILLVTGLLTRRVSMLPLRKVTDMSYRRSLFGWLFGYGEFVMESAGETQSLRRIRFLPNPDSLYLQLSNVLFANGPALAAD